MPEPFILFRGGDLRPAHLDERIASNIALNRTEQQWLGIVDGGRNGMALRTNVAPDEMGELNATVGNCIVSVNVEGTMNEPRRFALHRGSGKGKNRRPLHHGFLAPPSRLKP
jgi:hypothetical protein